MDILKLIPQLFFDLISRVVPGSVAIVMLAAVTNIKPGKLMSDFWEGAPAIQNSVLFLGFGFVVAAYLIGQLISPVSDFIENQIVKRIFPTYFQALKIVVSKNGEYSPAMRDLLLKEMGLDNKYDVHKITSSQCKNSVFVWYDWLRVNSPDAGARAAKIRAEYRMYSQNTVVFLMVLIVHLLWIFAQQRAPHFSLIIGVTLAILASLWATARTYRIFQWAVINQFYSAKTGTS